MTFNDQPELDGDTLRLRGLREEDREALYQAASDPETWAGHPAKDRHMRDVFDPYFDMLLAAGGTLIVFDKSRDRVIGCSRYYVGPDAPDDIAIGFTFLNHRYWGGEVNLRMKQLMLDHAFAHFDRVWFHIAPDNIRSQKATMKIGAVFTSDEELDLSGSVLPWKCYRLDRAAWTQVKANRLDG
ncbi:GNAT family N-acetyltransferase [uncultured Aliiroseovarius sp.]|uniref:GNAT family N-acetyltransferase n=1 Tax=uncultured Aliiroseovarius sp. TaxID=1658783 RepID=UPI00260CEF16|nr:GNAT family N-acetyltransferase [uncultured Aliiroseovarius sp.]